ncbi:hypothetical protein FT663_04522 [Candidozyma haemuli var. vulneris]|uniref:Major facilitator superfamily (MFS) profile domain-containing protein n=1 Tax=Candidozyma haemuli TaxID=45357 RepID=A0A2V1ANH4_9ASCO|nr:hypothetical protein CXQ85_001559 [[Candida] haemuloni]KAF3986482.1 hypothetical protein FT662_04549 [[Candida] haemuloni var. vulneris]KAF3987263.1 hypothetical protein FT663_04522 [[Candida] haemuloni var. vulneris]PVH19254.1 hypothetical protein CXQ85_001559 [[Candida] haemuloni]
MRFFTRKKSSDDPIVSDGGSFESRTLDRTEGTLEKHEERVDVNSSDNSGTRADSDKEPSDLEDQMEFEESNPFLDPFIAEHYRQKYEACNYECREAFDPHLQWTRKEDKKVMRKVDKRAILSACIMFFALQVNRGNLHEAVADNLLDDLNMDTNDYNLGNTLNLVAFLCAELPSQIISKAIGPDIWIPIQICCWCAVSTCQGALQDKTGFLICRVLIGLFQGGFIPDMVLWLSYFYKSGELPLRLWGFWTALALTQTITSVLAYFILRMRGVGGLTGWQWLFIIEGSFTFLIGVASFYLMVPSVVQTRNKLHPKGWFTEREEKIVVNRILRDDPNKGGMNNRQALSFKAIRGAIMDYNLWPIFAIGLLAYIPMSTVQPYMVLAMKDLGFSTLDVNLLTIPSHILQIIFMLAVTLFSEKIDERGFTCLSLPIVTIPFLAAMRWWPGTMEDAWLTWFFVTMVLSAPYIHAMCVAWVSRNSNSIESRSVCSALYNMFVQAGSIIAYNIYREDDLPKYRRGNEQLFGIMIGLLPVILFAKGFYVWKNKKRDEVWDTMTDDEKQTYIAETTDRGNKRLDFRFDH